MELALWSQEAGLPWWRWGCWVGTLLSLWDLPLKRDPSISELSKDRKEDGSECQLCVGPLVPKAPTLTSRAGRRAQSLTPGSGRRQRSQPHDETP